MRSSVSSYEYSGGYCFLRSPFGDESDLIFAVCGEHCIYPTGVSTEGIVTSNNVTNSHWLVPRIFIYVSKYM